MFVLPLVVPVCATDKPAADGEALWKPEVGDFWVYQLVVDLPKKTKILEKIGKQEPEK